MNLKSAAIADLELPARVWQFGVRKKVLAVLLITLLLTLSITNYLSLADQRVQLLATSVERGRSISTLVAKDAAASVAAYDYQTLRLSGRLLVGHDHIRYIGIVNNRGHLMAATGNATGPLSGALCRSDSTQWTDSRPTYTRSVNRQTASRACDEPRRLLLAADDLRSPP